MHPYSQSLHRVAIFFKYEMMNNSTFSVLSKGYDMGNEFLLFQNVHALTRICLTKLQVPLFYFSTVKIYNQHST